LPGILTRVSDDDVDSDISTAASRAKRLMPSSSFNTEPKLVEFLTSLPCVVYESAADLTIRVISQNVFDLIGIQPDALQGKRALWGERLYPEDRMRLLERLEQLQSSEIVSENHRLLDDQGFPVWVSHRFQKIGKNNDACIRGCITPIPREVRAKSVDCAVISHFIHKIGNHFQLINLLIGSLKRSGASVDEIAGLQDTVDRAVEFTRSFSHYSQTPVYLAAVDLGDVIRSVFQSTAPLFSEKNVSYKLLGHESLYGAVLSADPFLLELALIEVIQNALDATKSADQVILAASREASTRTSPAIAKICIGDTGSGMEKELLAKAPLPFFTSKPERNGIGLSMAMRIVEIHGGLLSISSHEEIGSQVEILLPLTDALARSER
jgi:signal transduction histidine kinase